MAKHVDYGNCEHCGKPLASLRQLRGMKPSRTEVDWIVHEDSWHTGCLPPEPE